MIEKRTWKPYFQLMKDGIKNVEVRLADFPLKEGDEILFREYDQTKLEYTGREIIKKVKHLFKVNFTDFNKFVEIYKVGHYLIEFDTEPDPAGR